MTGGQTGAPSLKVPRPGTDGRNVLPVPAPVQAASGLDVRISERIRELRTSRGWRQQDLAVAAGWARATVVALETNQKRLTVRDAAVLCRVLRVPLAALVEGAAEAEVLGLSAVTQSREADGCSRADAWDRPPPGAA